MLEHEEIVISTHDLCRQFKSYKKPEGLLNSLKGFVTRQYIHKMALAPTNLQIGAGQIVGLVGANGAGKTTLLKLLSGLISPTSGHSEVLGFDPSKRQDQYLQKISILLGQKNQLWWDLPPADSFSLLTKIYSLEAKDVKIRYLELAELLNCQDLLHVQLRRLSLGERMKMEIIGSLLHNPQVLFLDEPTIGLDIVAQGAIRKFLAEYVRSKKPTVILTSHYMDDISKLADRLLLISHGQIVYDGTVANFSTRSEQKQKLSLKIKAPASAPIPLTAELTLPAHANFLIAELRESEVPEVLKKILSISTIEDLKLEEANFEDVIHEFLRQDKSLR